MYFNVYHDLQKEKEHLPKGALVLAGLTEAASVTIQAEPGWLLAAWNDMTTAECVKCVEQLTTTASTLLTQLVLHSQEAAGKEGPAPKADPLDALDRDFRDMLVLAGADLNGLRSLMAQERPHG